MIICVHTQFNGKSKKNEISALVACRHILSYGRHVGFLKIIIGVICIIYDNTDNVLRRLKTFITGRMKVVFIEHFSE